MKKCIIFFAIMAVIVLANGCSFIDQQNQSPIAQQRVNSENSIDAQLKKIDNENNLNKSWQQFEKPSDDELEKILTPLQYHVTQEEGTEEPFSNEYWEHKGEGIYVDIVSGEPLFSSIDKFDSKTGWPSFTKPLVAENIIENTDYKLMLQRTEIRSRYANSHLGHVFTDGPAPTNLRYCMNSAALRFVPKGELEEQGYGEFGYLFE